MKGGGGGQEGLKREGGDAGLVRRCQLARSHTDARCQHVPSRRERRSATACARPAGSAPEPVAARRQRKESLVAVLRPRRPGPHAACAARGAARRVAGGTGLRCHGGRVSPSLAPRRSAGQADPHSLPTARAARRPAPPGRLHAARAVMGLRLGPMRARGTSVTRPARNRRAAASRQHETAS